jgi:hypothetical protein
MRTCNGTLDAYQIASLCENYLDLAKGGAANWESVGFAALESQKALEEIGGWFSNRKPGEKCAQSPLRECSEQDGQAHQVEHAL